MESKEILEALYIMDARQKADTVVLSALIASHRRPKELIEAWRELSSEALAGEHLDSLRLGRSNLTRDVYAKRVAFWQELIQESAAGP